MDKFTLKQLLIIRSKMWSLLEFIIEGTSMFPIIHPGDIVNVYAKREYSVGDILAFFYRDEKVLVHRLLKIKNERYFCKGDNAFRLEIISKNDIIGAVKIESDFNNTPDFIFSSYMINYIFKKNGYNVEKTRLSNEYICYAEKYLQNKYNI